MTETITSTHNPRIKELRALRERRGRDRTGSFMAEGEDMLAEALRHSVPPTTVFYDAEALAPGAPPLDALPPSVELVGATAHALGSAGSLGSGSRVVSVWPQLWSAVEDVAAAGGAAPGTGLDAIVHLHEVSDPGNVGAVVRAASAFGARGVVLSPGSADPFGTKAVRAAMGALFAVPVVRASLAQVRAVLGPRWRSIGLVPRIGVELSRLAGKQAALFVLGSERTGLPAELVEQCDEVAHVALAPEGADSLNVAMTATLCLYEAAVHRLSPTDG